MFLSKPSFSEHEFFFFSGGAFCTWIRCKISVRFVSSRIDELFCCSTKSKRKEVLETQIQNVHEKKTLWVQRIVFIFWVQRINSFFLWAAPKRTQMLSGWARMNSLSWFQSSNTCFVRKHWKVSLKTNLCFAQRKSPAKLEEMQQPRKWEISFSLCQNLRKFGLTLKAFPFGTKLIKWRRKTLMPRPFRRTSKNKKQGFL